MAPTPGWYDDPAGTSGLRWWDGERWTDRTRAAPAATPPPPVTRQDPVAPEPTTDDAASDVPAVPDAPSSGGESGDVPAPDRDDVSTPSGRAPLFDPTRENTSRLAATVAPDASSPTPLLPLSELFADAALPEGGDKIVEIPGQEVGRSRRAPILGTVLLFVVVGVIAGVALTRPGNVFNLRVGDCFDRLEDQVVDGANAASSSVRDVPTVACEEPHDNEVYAVHQLELDAFPGAVSMESISEGLCLDSFRDVVGYPLELTNLDVAVIRPSQTTWNADDRAVVCFLQRADGAKLVGSRIGLAEGEGKGVFQLSEGDCFDAPLAGADPGTEVVGVSVVDCSLPHFGQVYEIAQLPQGGYPGREELTSTAQELCREAFTGFVGQPFEESVLWFNALPPTETSWGAGDREVVCYVTDPINGQIIGEARQWALQNRDEVLEFGEGYDVTGLEVGDCFDDPPADGGSPEGIPVETLPCEQPHDNEVFLAFDLEDGTWPGGTRLTTTVDERCNPAYEEYVGSDRIDLTWFAFQPTRETWEEGDRRVVCALYDVDFLKIRGSQARTAV